MFKVYFSELRNSRKMWALALSLGTPMLHGGPGWS